LPQVNSVTSSLNLERGSGDEFHLLLDHPLCTGARDDRHMFGGVGAAAAVAAMEALSGQSALWLSAQFHTIAKVGAVLAIEPETVLAGKSVTQFTLRGRVAGKTVIEALGATGIHRPQSENRSWSGPVAPPPPEACPPVSVHRNAEEDIHGLFEARQVSGRYGKFSHDPRSDDGKVHVWFRPFSGVIDRPLLAIIADFLPACTSNALGIRSGGRSMDNLMRFARLVPTEWVLAEYHIVSVADGVGHGTATLYAEDGSLLAFGSQSFRLTLNPRPGEVGAS
jgi:acyl-CoA thioesterase